MPYVVGFALALLTFLFARIARLDRDRALYPVLLIVIASYYVLFAVMGGSTRATMIESMVTTLFAIVAVAGFRTGLWLVAAALAAHGVFDLIHGYMISNPGVPVWWPPFCLAYDITLAICLGWLVYKGKLQPVS